MIRQLFYKPISKFISMARKRKMARRRRRPAFSLINSAFALGYANILTQNLFSTNPIQFILGSGGAGVGMVSGGGIGIGELIKRPDLFQTVADRAINRLPQIAVQTLALQVGEKVFKSVSRGAVSRVNRQIVKPMLGAGVKL
tara:strand:- start:13 stop:438 length:426 start_codon:yes stop_codon:yes gene_type:complete